MDARVRRRTERRDMFRLALGAAVGAGAFAYANTAAAQTAPTDADILNFALNLEYLEAQFYAYAFSGAGLPANQQTPGSSSAAGTQGAVQIRPTETGQPRAVVFGTSNDERAVQQYAREIAADEAAHVAFLRTALGNAAVPQPALNISGGQSGAFTAAARAAGFFNEGAVPAAVATAAGLDLANRTFDPYANSNAFLLGAFIFEDVGVTAYKGASPLITNTTFLQAAAGILAVEAYHASIIRTTLYARGVDVPALRDATTLISNARDGLDGTADLDQDIKPMAGTGGQQSNIVPLDGNGIAYSRSTGQVLNIVYLNRSAVTMGGFFPAGVNGTIRAAAAN